MCIRDRVDTVGAKLKSGTRLVKANVAIVANAQQLQIHAAQMLDLSLIHI